MNIKSISLTLKVFLILSAQIFADKTYASEACHSTFLNYFLSNKRDLGMPDVCRKYMAVILRQNGKFKISEEYISRMEDIDKFFFYKAKSIQGFDKSDYFSAKKYAKLMMDNSINEGNVLNYYVAVAWINSISGRSVMDYDETYLCTREAVASCEIFFDKFNSNDRRIGYHLMLSAVPQVDERNIDCLIRLFVPEVMIKDITSSRAYEKCEAE